MVLTLTLADGSTATAEFTSTSVLTVSTDTATVGAWTDVVGLSLDADPVEADPELVQATVADDGTVVPVTPAPTSGDPGDETDAGTEPTSGDPIVVTDGSAGVATPVDGEQNFPPVGTSSGADVTVTLDTDSAPPADPAPVDDGSAPQSVGEALAQADATEPTDQDVPAPQADTPAPDEVVAATNDAIDVAVAGTAPDPHAHLAQAKADVDAALVQWPDDPHLADAKQQLADLAADLEAEIG